MILWLLTPTVFNDLKKLKNSKPFKKARHTMGIDSRISIKIIFLKK